MSRGNNIMKGQWYESIEKKASYLSNNYRVKCSCGHTLIMVHESRKICDWCGKWVFKDKSEEFKYRLNLTMNK